MLNVLALKGVNTRLKTAIDKREEISAVLTYNKEQKKQGLWSTLVMLNVLGLGLGSVVGFSYMALPQLTKLAHAQDHATALPWISTEKACQGDTRAWIDGACWDIEHDASF